MISIKEAKKIIEKNFPQRKVETINLSDALGRVITEDIIAPEPSPRFTNSAMDGFAVKWNDVQTANESNPITLPVIGESGAGVPFKKQMEKGQAIRISTGAMIPDEADTVIPQEDTKYDNRVVKIFHITNQYQNVRFKGDEFRQGDIILKKESEIQSTQIGLLAALGIQKIPVYRKPNVSVIITGTEIKPYHSTIQPWQIRDSNSVMLTSIITDSGGNIIFSKIVGDNLNETQRVLKEAIQKSDLIIFSGGVSVGPHDLVKAVSEKAGFKTLFWKVNQKPGKPLFAAKKENALLFGLPGNPVSAYMCYLLYIKPVIKYMLGKKEDEKIIKAQLKETIQNNLNRDHLMRVRIENYTEIPIITSLEKQGSHMLTSLTEADGFILVKSNEFLRAKSVVKVNLF